MPFKTKRDKSRAHKRWANFKDDEVIVYKPSVSREDKTEEHLNKQTGNETSIGDDISNTRRDLIKIAILATLVIGLQLLLKFYHIGI